MAAGAVYVTLVPVVLERVPTAALSAQLTVPGLLIVAEKFCVPPPLTLGVFGVTAKVVGGGGGVTAAGLMVMIAESLTDVPSTIAISATSVLVVTLEGGV